MKLKKYAAIAMASGLLVLGVSGCSTNNGADNKANDKQASAPAADKGGAEAEKGAVAANQRPDECGNQEQAGPEFSVGPFDMALHFFQPGVMVVPEGSTMKSSSYADSQMHLELDTKANMYATNWGYSVDETPADLHIMYSLKDKSGKEINKGMMMEMNAIDGSHYGINLPNNTITAPGDYDLTVTVYPPANYAIHQDYVTGVPAKGWFKPLTTTVTWKISKEALDIVNKSKREDPMPPTDKCTKYPMKMYEDKAAQETMEKAEKATPIPMGDNMMKH